MANTASGVTLRSATAADVPELGRICYEAFKDIADQHGFPPDFPSVEVGTGVEGLVVQDEKVYSVAAVRDGTPIGSNHIELWDEVAGVGPITVDIPAQGDGIGRMLMEDGLAQARAQGYDRVRLCQDSYNMRSLALYASLGFVVVEPLVLLELSAAVGVDAQCRPATADDIDAMDALCRNIYRTSRKNETATLLRNGFPAFVLDGGGSLRGYLIGTPLGHGVAESEDDMLRLFATYAATVPEPTSFAPVRSGELYRRALAAGHRNRKPMNLMALGTYDSPVGTWVPSVLY